MGIPRTLLAFSFILLTILHFFSPNEATQNSINEQEEEEDQIQMATTQSTTETELADECYVHENESLHALMDRICELCHDMYSHQRPNTRAECRSDCFRSPNFKRCLRLFKPIGRNGSQRRKLRLMAEELDAYFF